MNSVIEPHTLQRPGNMPTQEMQSSKRERLPCIGQRRCLLKRGFVICHRDDDVFAHFLKWSRKERRLPGAPRTDPYVQNYRIRLLPWVSGVEAPTRMQMQNADTREPTIRELAKASPGDAVAVTPSTQRMKPMPNHLGQEGFHTRRLSR